MKDLLDIQREWIKWLLESYNGREWLDTHVTSPENIQRLHRVVIHKQYDTTSEFLLNYLLGAFNRDAGVRLGWILHIQLNNELSKELKNVFNDYKL